MTKEPEQTFKGFLWRLALVILVVLPWNMLVHGSLAAWMSTWGATP